jgi:signal transduction histidine kinase
MSTLRPSSTSTTSTWIRWMPLWHGLFYMSLVLATGIALVEGLHTWQRTGVLLGLSLVFGLWYTISVVISPLPGKILVALLLTALCVWQQVTLAGGIGGNLFLTLAAGVSGILMVLFIYTIVEQSQQQQRLIGELETTHQALATAERQAGILEERQRLARYRTWMDWLFWMCRITV